MKKLLSALILALMICSAPAQAATSTVNPNIPANNAPLVSSVVRTNFAATYNDINSLYALFDQSLKKTSNLGDLSNTSAARINLGLGNVENTALSTWPGSSNITTLGTVVSASFTGPGSASLGDTSLQPALFSGGATPTAGNLYGIAVIKTGFEEAMLGINKNTTTGSIPASAVYLSTYNGSGQIAIGRGNTAGLPNSADILVGSTGNVSMPNNLTVSGSINGTHTGTFNGVTLTSAGSATSYLNAAGAYTTPAGGGSLTGNAYNTYGAPIVFSSQHTAFGDSITCGYGAGNSPTCNQNGYANFLATDEAASLTNYAVQGAYSCDQSYSYIFKNVSPGQTKNPIYTTMIGTNDATQKGVGSYEAVFNNCQKAGLSWLAIPSTFKTYAQTCSVTGTWTNDSTIWFSSVGRLASSTGATMDCPITTYGGPIYVWYRQTDSSTVTFTYAVDGGSTTAVSVATSPAIAALGTNGVGFIRITGLAAGAHTVNVVETNGSSLMMAGVGTPPPYSYWGAPTVYVGGVLRQSNDSNAAKTLAYDNDVQANVTQLSGDGLHVNFVPVRNYVNTTTDMYDILHPNTNGHGHLRDAFAAIEQFTPYTSLVLTTTGSSGAATFTSGTLNIPQYSGGGGTPGGAVGTIQFNSNGSFSGISNLVNLTFNSSTSTLTSTATASTAFSALTGSTNTTAAMVVGTGASIAPTGSGTITATAAPASGLTGSTLAAGVTGSSLTSVGTIATGVWNGTVVAGQYGGTGVANTGKTITIGGNFSTVGAFTTALTATGNTAVTLPTTGTLATLAGTEALTNKSVNGVTLGTGGSATLFLTSAGTFTAPFALTTTGSSGAATFSAGTLNIPQYTGGGVTQSIVTANKSANYTALSSDTGKYLYFTGSGPFTLTMPASPASGDYFYVGNFATGGSLAISGGPISPGAGPIPFGATWLLVYNATNGAWIGTLSFNGSGSGTVTSVDMSGGTTGLTYSGGPITSSGSITTAGVLVGANGGTGVANTGKTLTLGGNLTTSGAFATTLTSTNTTTVTLPTTGTLATLAGTETLTNKTYNGVNLGTGGSSTLFLTSAGTYTAPFSLTTTGSSGAATFSAGTLNIPQYTGGGGGSPGGSATQIQYNSAGTSFQGAANAIITSEGNINLGEYSSTNPTAFSSGSTIFSRKRAGNNTLTYSAPLGRPRPVQTDLGSMKISGYFPIGNTNATINVFGAAVGGTALGTAAGISWSNTNLLTSTMRVGFNSTAAVNINAGYLGGNGFQAWRGNASGLGGFHLTVRFAFETAAANQRVFCGLGASLPITATANPSTILNLVGIAADSGDTALKIMSNDGSGTATSTSLGASFPAATSGAFYEMQLYAAPNDTSIYYSLERLDSAAFTEGVLTTDLPVNTSLMGFQCGANTGTGTSVISTSLISATLERDF